MPQAAADRSSSWILPFVLAAGFLASGCGVLIGNVKPVEDKSNAYRVADLQVLKADWRKLESSLKEAGAAEDVSDVAFQSKTTSSIISLNSACRPGGDQRSLKEISRLLFLGLSQSSAPEEQTLEVERVPALQTTVEGRLNNEPVRLRTVVLRKGECVYDLMYVARPEQFDKQLGDFTHFVSSLRIR